MISVIIPVYNVEEYLRPCLESARTQTYRDIEVVAVNDGSTDGSAAIIEEYCRRDGRFRSVTTANGGLSKARNTGIEHSRGEWLVFLDGDDMLHPEGLARMMEIAGESGADLVACRWEQGEEARFAPLGEKRWTEKSGEETARDMMYRHELEPTASSKLYRRELLGRLRFREGTWYEDVDVTYRIALEANKTAVSRDRVYFYRQRAGSFMHVWQTGRLDILEVTERMEAYCREECEGLLKAARDRRFAACFNIFLLASREGLEDVARGCWEVIERYRRDVAVDRRSRLKNRAGALLSLLGPKATRKLAGLM